MRNLEKSLSVLLGTFFGCGVLLSLAPRDLSAQDSQKPQIDVSKLKAELEQSRKSAGAASEADNAELQKEFQKLMAAETELMGRLAEHATPTAASTEPTKVENTAFVSPSTKTEISVTDQGDKEALKKNVVSANETLGKVSEPTSKDATGAIEVVKNSKRQQAQRPNAEPAKEPGSELEGLKMVDPGELQATEIAEGQRQNIEKVEKQLKEVKQQLDATRRNNRDLTRELEETRNRLIIAETQVERLSNVIEERNRNSLSKYTGESNATLRTYKAPKRVQVNAAAPAPRPTEKPADEMPVGVVVAEKAYLRTGPGKDNSPLMAVPRGTHLAIETRNGEWYRVVAPTGARAWVSSDVIGFAGN